VVFTKYPGTEIHMTILVWLGDSSWPLVLWMVEPGKEQVHASTTIISIPRTDEKILHLLERDADGTCAYTHCYRTLGAVPQNQPPLDPF
jgi:hypothetical protein